MVTIRLLLVFMSVQVGDMSAQYIAPIQNWQNWYFGYQASLSFSGATPISLGLSATVGNEGAASISDTSGLPQFYTDGCTVWNRLHMPMPNGLAIGDNQCGTSAQGALIIPRPEHPGRYYVFCAALEWWSTVDTLFEMWSEVDMALDGGNGDVINSSKNTHLCSYHSEQQCAIPHANGTDVWLLLHEGYASQYWAFLVTENGVSSTPVISTMPTPPTTHMGSIGPLVASVQGDRIASVTDVLPTRMEKCSFNSATGIVSLEATYAESESNSYFHGLCFSPDGNFLYATVHKWPSGNELFQFDATTTTDATLLASKFSVDGGSYVDMALGPDERIYVQQFPDSLLSVIAEPNVLGAGCNLINNAVSLTPGRATNLPNLFYWPATPEGVNEVGNKVSILQPIPQPMSGQTTIQLPCAIAYGSVPNWFDAAGRAIDVEDHWTNSSIDITRARLQSGYYSLRVVLSDGSVGVAGVIVQ